MKKIKPIRWGMALTAAGTSLANMGGISLLNGAKGELIYWCVVAGFFLSVFGIFITVLHKPSIYEERMRRLLEQKNPTIEPDTDL